jgi:Raf kinase inhibitor-like YbhB/YbcL family protein
MRITSSAFKSGGQIPIEYTGAGHDASPPLAWTDLPGGCKSLALVCEDPDAPKSVELGHSFIHWVIYNLPPMTRSLSEALAPHEHLDQPLRADQGKNSFGKVGYSGPMPPEGRGPHRYHFVLHALDAELGIGPGATYEEFMHAAKPHILKSTRLTGIFERKKRAA